MTGPEDTNSSTRPISVAELLARNGTIGAAPPGGRRRRRRGDTDSVTVAELTGEIPIIRGHGDETGAAAESNGAVDHDEQAEVATATEADVETAKESEARDVEAQDDRVADPDDVFTAAPTSTEEDSAYDTDDDYADAVADYTSHVTERETDVDLDFFAPPRRSSYAPRRFSTGAVGAEQMSPDPVEEAVLESPVELAPAEADEDTAGAPATADTSDTSDTARDDRDELPSYLRSTDDGLFGGPTVADGLTRGDARPRPENVDVDEAEDDVAAERPSAMRPVVHGAWIVGQCIIAVAFGAGLFVAFDQLWKWNNIVALVLSVLVILGLVVGVRVVRKTEDIGSTLIAVAVGALVTLGPLALLQSG
jgi:hypothetical protein